jgi:hypothetical protein
MSRPLVIGVAVGLLIAAVAGLAGYFLLRAPAPGSLEIAVVSSGGDVASGARVTVEGTLRIADSGGTVRFAEIDAGDYAVVARLPGYAAAMRTVSIHEGEASYLTITVRDARLIGQLVEQAAQPMPVSHTRVEVETSSGTRRVPVSQDGRFAIQHAPVGKGTVRVLALVRSHTAKAFPRYDPSTFPVTLSGGENTERLPAPLSAVETAVRMQDLEAENRYATYLRSARLYYSSVSPRYGCTEPVLAKLRLQYEMGATGFVVLGIKSRQRWKLETNYAGKLGDRQGQYTHTFREVTDVFIRNIRPRVQEPLKATLRLVKEGALWKIIPDCTPPPPVESPAPPPSEVITPCGAPSPFVFDVVATNTDCGTAYRVGLQYERDCLGSGVTTCTVAGYSCSGSFPDPVYSQVIAVTCTSGSSRITFKESP